MKSMKKMAPHAFDRWARRVGLTLGGLLWLGCQGGGDPLGTVRYVEPADARIFEPDDASIILPDIPFLDPPDSPTVLEEYDVPTAPPAVCGDSLLGITAGEECDDGDSESGDGCSSICTLERDYACPYLGKDCVPTVSCGDGKLGGTEQCDDANKANDDGCSATCQLEKGWACPTPGSRCQAAACGDKMIIGLETCDDGNVLPADGCDATCRLEPGFVCPTVGVACQPTVCGNAVQENTEACDDGNLKPWDGCSPTCEREPTCVAGECASVCGDGMILPEIDKKEACDDGNLREKDGCSGACAIEPGWNCTNAPTIATDSLSIPVVFRDFISFPAAGETQHPNFQWDWIEGNRTIKTGLVKNELGADGKPVYAGICGLNTPCTWGRQLTNQADFDEWYRDTPKSVRADTVLSLTRADQLYVFNANLLGGFFPFGKPPLENIGWVAQGKELTSTANAIPQNFGFTTELRYWFQLQGGERLEFAGDDDVWVFLKGALLIDLGGRHSVMTGSLSMTDEEIAKRGLTRGKLYEIAFFHAERHTSESNFKLTLSGFSRTKTSCVSICGDGIVVGNEICDDGPLNGTYNHCDITCSRLGPHCGDGVVQSTDGEACDDGVNLTTYGRNGKPACAPGCQWSPFCGDGKVDSTFGEVCDNQGTTTPDGCRPNCIYSRFCGDGIFQPEYGETCDDGNIIDGDGCSALCKADIVIP